MAVAPSTATALVTGASTGIGLATTTLLVSQGHAVWAGVRNDADAARLAEVGAHPLLLDVTVPEQVDEAAATVGDALDLLVNNAGVAITSPIELLTDDELRAQFEVNLFGVHRVTRALLPALLTARGRIVNVSSISGLVGLPFFGPYAASKFALEGYTDSLRREVSGVGVRVSLVEPGEVETPIWDKSVPGPDRLAGLPDRYRTRAAALAEATATNTDRVTAEEVAEVIVRAATTRRPRARYALPLRTAAMGRLARILPDAVVDVAIERELRRMEQSASGPADASG